MALRISVETPYRITCAEAHCVIQDVRIDKREVEYDTEGELVTPKSFTVQYSGLIWATEGAYGDGGSPVSGFNFDFPLNDNGGKTQYNLVKQSYLNLKTRDGFQDGEDC